MTARPSPPATPADLLTRLADLGVEYTQLRVDHLPGSDLSMTLWLRSRSDFLRVVEAFGMAWEEHAGFPGQRLFSTKSLNPLLIQAVSFPHHSDWEPVGAVAS